MPVTLLVSEAGSPTSATARSSEAASARTASEPTVPVRTTRLARAWSVVSRRWASPLGTSWSSSATPARVAGMRSCAGSPASTALLSARTTSTIEAACVTPGSPSTRRSRRSTARSASGSRMAPADSPPITT